MTFKQFEKIKKANINNAVHALKQEFRVMDSFQDTYLRLVLGILHEKGGSLELKRQIERGPK